MYEKHSSKKNSNKRCDLNHRLMKRCFSKLQQATQMHSKCICFLLCNIYNACLLLTVVFIVYICKGKKRTANEITFTTESECICCGDDVRKVFM